MDVSMTGVPDVSTLVPMLQAIKNDDVYALDKAISQVADPQMYANILLSSAIVKCNADAVRIVLAHGANPTAATSNSRELMESLSEWTRSYVFVQREFRILETTPITPLVLAMLHLDGNDECVHDIVTQLLEAGCDTHIHDDLPLRLAVWNFDVDIMGMLLAHVHSRDQAVIAMDLLEWMRFSGYVPSADFDIEMWDMIDVLCAAGARLDDTPNLALIYYAARGLTSSANTVLVQGHISQETLDEALMEAAHASHVSVAQRMLDAGAQPMAYGGRSMLISLIATDWAMAQVFMNHAATRTRFSTCAHMRQYMEIAMRKGWMDYVQFMMRNVPEMMYACLTRSHREVRRPYPTNVVVVVILHDMEHFVECLISNRIRVPRNVTGVVMVEQERIHTIITVLMERGNCHMTEDLVLEVLYLSGYTKLTSLHALGLYYGGRAYDDSEGAQDAWARVRERLARREAKLRSARAEDCR